MRPLIGSLCALAVSLACVRTPREGSHPPALERVDAAVSSTSGLVASSSRPSAPPSLRSSTQQPLQSLPPKTDTTARAQTPVEAPPSPLEQLRDALSEDRFEEARLLLDTKALQDFAIRPFVLGYVELELGQYDAALDALSVSEQRWPQLTKVITPLKRRALLRSSRYAEVIPGLAKSNDTEELLIVAERLLQDGEPQQAARWLRRAAMFSGARSKQAPLRALRAKVALANKQPYGALADWRWLAMNAPLEPASAGADDLIAAHFPKTPLKTEQRYRRAQRFADAGRVEETERELGFVRGASDFQVKEGELLHTLGWAHYKARDYANAAEVLARAVEAKSHTSLNDMYYSGKSLARIGKVREALATFDRVAKLSPKGALANHARFALGREWLVLGEWENAIDAHTAFIKAYPKSDERPSAERERAVAYFALGQHERAANAFRSLRNSSNSDTSLLTLLEAVAREYAGDVQTAVTLLRSLELTTPLTYAGHASRERLRALGEPVVPLAPAPNQASAPLVSLPEPVKTLDALGFSGASETALIALESEWLRDVEGDRYATLCETYGQLSASRRRYVLGAAKASSVNFFSRPNEREEWLWQCTYPTPYPEWVTKYTSRWQVSPALVYAIMRQESGFHSSIESPARARGLMQIIPPTASRIADELGEEVMAGLMDSPQHNIRYGTYYLNKLLATFDQHPAPAIAAYNAGPYSAMRWRHATTELPVELFIARIPFNETRNYVQRVLANLNIYETLYPELGKLDIPLNLSSNGVAADSPMSPSEIPVDPSWY